MQHRLLRDRYWRIDYTKQLRQGEVCVCALVARQAAREQAPLTGVSLADPKLPMRSCASTTACHVLDGSQQTKRGRQIYATVYRVVAVPSRFNKPYSYYFMSGIEIISYLFSQFPPLHNIPVLSAVRILLSSIATPTTVLETGDMLTVGTTELVAAKAE